MQTKALMMAPHREAVSKAVPDENAALDTLRGATANQEALNGFLEKRAPDFSNF